MENDSQVKGLIASGDNKLAIDCTPATKPWALPCNYWNLILTDLEQQIDIVYNYINVLI